MHNVKLKGCFIIWVSLTVCFWHEAEPYGIKLDARKLLVVRRRPRHIDRAKPLAWSFRVKHVMPHVGSRMHQLVASETPRLPLPRIARERHPTDGRCAEGKRQPELPSLPHARCWTRQ